MRVAAIRTVTLLLAITPPPAAPTFESASKVLLANEAAATVDDSNVGYVANATATADAAATERYQEDAMAAARDAVNTLAMGVLHALELSLLLLLLVTVCGLYAAYKALFINLELIDTACKRRALERLYGLTTGGKATASGITQTVVA